MKISHNQGDTYLKDRKYNQAETEYLNAQATDPANPWPFIGYARVAQHQQMHVEALKRWTTVKEKFPDKIEAYLGLGNAYNGLYNHDEAEAMFLKAQAMDQGNPWAFIGYARVAQHQQMHAEALKRWTTVKDKFPDKIEAYLGLGNAYSGLSEYKQAEKMYLKAQAMDPSNPWGFIGYARVAQYQQMHAEALERWTTVKDKFPDKIEAYLGLGNAYSELSNYDKAEAMFLKTQAMDPANPWGFIGYARVAQRQHIYAQALKRWTTVKEKFPDKIEAYIGHGDIYTCLAKYKKAETMFLKAQAMDPGNPWAFINYARVAQHQQMYAEALERWTTVKEKFPNKIDAYLGLGDVYTALEEFKEAEEMYLNAQLIEPETPLGFGLHQQLLEIKRRINDEKQYLLQAKGLVMPSGIKLLVCIYTCESDLDKLNQFYSSHLFRFLANNCFCKIIEVYANETLSQPKVNNTTMTVNCPEQYSSLSIKTYKMIDYCVNNYEFTHILKIDSSILGYNKNTIRRNNVKRLSEYNLLKLITNPKFFIEYNGALPMTSSQLDVENWATSHNVTINAGKVLEKNHTISFFMGKFYLIDRSFACYISKHGELMAKEHEKYMYGVEDLMIGRLFEQYNNTSE